MSRHGRSQIARDRRPAARAPRTSVASCRNREALRRRGADAGAGAGAGALEFGRDTLERQHFGEIDAAYLARLQTKAQNSSASGRKEKLAGGLACQKRATSRASRAGANSAQASGSSARSLPRRKPLCRVLFMSMPRSSPAATPPDRYTSAATSLTRPTTSLFDTDGVVLEEAPNVRNRRPAQATAQIAPGRRPSRQGYSLTASFVPRRSP
jgi:hypothetical protein